MILTYGILVVKGSDLKLNKYSLDNTELNVEGDIISMTYNDKAYQGKNKEGVFTKIFK